MKIKALFGFGKKVTNKKDEVKYQELVRIYLKHLHRIPTPSLDFPQNRSLKFLHSGNSGDIIYSIPCALSIAKGNNVDFLLRINKPANYQSFIKHPMGKVTLNESTANLLVPLLDHQDYVDQTKIYDMEVDMEDVNLDLIRDYPLLLDRGNIARWYFQVFGVNYDLNRKWLTAPKDVSANDAIVISRSERYKSPEINYDFIRKYPNVQFVGLEREYWLMQQSIPNLQYRPVGDFLEMASIINGARLFIGNQSFPFSIAEGLKVNRILEVHFECPNVTVYGENGYDFCFQPQFEKIVKERYEYT